MSQTILIESNPDLNKIYSLNLSTFVGTDVIMRQNAEEALALATSAGVKALVLYHVSPRYGRAEIERAVEEARMRTGFSGDLAVVAGFTHADPFYP